MKRVAYLISGSQPWDDSSRQDPKSTVRRKRTDFSRQTYLVESRSTREIFGRRDGASDAVVLRPLHCYRSRYFSPISAGRVYIVPGNDECRISRNGTFPAVSFRRGFSLAGSQTYGADWRRDCIGEIYIWGFTISRLVFCWADARLLLGRRCSGSSHMVILQPNISRRMWRGTS